jgi:hypothetical protein
MRSHVGWFRAASSLLLTLALALAAAPVLAADTTVDTVVKLQTPKKDKGRTDGALDEVPLSLWIPDGVPVVRGAVMNPFNLKAVTQSHWQEACRLWGFALIGANYFAVKNQEFPTTLQAALKEFAAKTGRKELEHVPLCFVGMSAGAGMSMHFARAMPDRTIAVGPVCLEVGPDTAETRGIPIVTVFGDKDMQQMPQLAAKLPVQRKEGARWAIAVQWGRGHEFAAANNIVIPLFDHAICRRYPAGVTPAAGPVKLVDIPENEGWLGDRGTWETNFAAIASFAAFQGDKGQACWLADEYLACVWREKTGGGHHAAGRPGRRRAVRPRGC